MFQGPVTLRGGEAAILLVYSTAAVIRSWTVYRSAEGAWSLRAEVTRADPFKLRQKELLFRAPRKGGYFVWPVLGAALQGSRQLVATLGPPIS